MSYDRSRMRRLRGLLVLATILSTTSCKSSSSDGGSPDAGGGSATTTTKPGATAAPELYAERAAVLEAIESGRIEDAEATLRNASPSADVRYLRAKIAAAKQDGETAYREIKRAVEEAPGNAEYQYELGIIAPLPVGGLNDTQLETRLKTGGIALSKAVALEPHEPKYQYAYAFFLTSAPPQDGGNPVEGKKRFDELLLRHPDSVWAHRVLFDRAAENDDLDTAEAEAAKAGALDANEGARLFLLAAGTRLIAGDIEKTRADLEAAAKLKPAAAAGFCDAGSALDNGSRPELAEPFWKRCLEIDPRGVKAPQARARLGVQ